MTTPAYGRSARSGAHLGQQPLRDGVVFGDRLGRQVCELRHVANVQAVAAHRAAVQRLPAAAQEMCWQNGRKRTLSWPWWSKRCFETNWGALTGGTDSGGGREAAAGQLDYSLHMDSDAGNSAELRELYTIDEEDG
jgi:hypothetical protein